MSSWMSNLRNFGRQPSQPRTNSNQPPSRGNTSSPSANSPSSLVPPNLPVAPGSPSLPINNMQANEQAHQTNQGTKKVPLFFREEHSGFIVKGNFMTLAAKPAWVEEAEWIAHQVTEQYRLLAGKLKIVQTEDRTNGRGLCNEQSCPNMSAGAVIYPWYDTSRNPINLPAAHYIKNIQTWVAGKIADESLFPTSNFQTPPALPTPQQTAADPNWWLGKSSGFPQRFEAEVKNMYKQMFRCYAHLYWSHWLTFWDVNLVRDLNTCFVHFMTVGKVFHLLSDKDTEPMQPLIDLWIRRGDLPTNASGNGSTPSSAAPQTPSSSAPSASGGSAT